MSFKMIYDKRNRGNLDDLADNTKVAAYKWYQYCMDNKIQILIYETIRTKATQASNVKNGKSKTMHSWHLTGQALDWVLVNSNGDALWDAYKTSSGLKVINYAKSIGFTSGHDWGWDSPHLQYDKIKYGKDTYNNKGKAPTTETGGLTMDQYNKLKQLIDEQSKQIALLQSQLAKKSDSVNHDMSVWHKDSTDWAFKYGILKGNGEGMNTKGTVTREEALAFLYRYNSVFK